MDFFVKDLGQISFSDSPKAALANFSLKATSKFHRAPLKKMLTSLLKGTVSISVQSKTFKQTTWTCNQKQQQPRYVRSLLPTSFFTIWRIIGKFERPDETQRYRNKTTDFSGSEHCREGAWVFGNLVILISVPDSIQNWLSIDWTEKRGNYFQSFAPDDCVLNLYLGHTWNLR